MQDTQANQLVTTIQQDMRQALKNGDQLECDTLRTLLARISNAEAVSAPSTNQPSVGVGSSEMARKELSLADVQQIITDEINEIQSVLRTIDKTSNYARELQEKQAVVQKYL